MTGGKGSAASFADHIDVDQGVGAVIGRGEGEFTRGDGFGKHSLYGKFAVADRCLCEGFATHLLEEQCRATDVDKACPENCDRAPGGAGFRVNSDFARRAAQSGAGRQ